MVLTIINAIQPYLAVIGGLSILCLVGLAVIYTVDIIRERREERINPYIAEAHARPRFYERSDDDRTAHEWAEFVKQLRADDSAQHHHIEPEDRKH